METMHAAGRRNLPPVPRPVLDAPVLSAGSPEENPAEQTMELRRRVPGDAPGEPPAEGLADDDDTAAFAPVTDPPIDAADHDPHDEADQGDDHTAGHEADHGHDHTADDDADPDADPDAVFDAALDPALLAAADEPEHALDDDDPAQGFVSELRAAAADFAAAAGAQTAVVREAVPPARHRRSRCRVVLRYADGAEADLTFLGAVGRPGTPAWQGFDRQIRHWLGTGQQRQSAWLVEDTEAPDGVAVDVPAWLAAG